jgi:lipid-A-disaccharide synthase-like uncharacterized protein
MKSSPLVCLALSVLLALSTVTTSAGPAATPRHTGHAHATAVWIIFGCAGSIIFTAYLKHVAQHQQLTALEAETCGLAYWFRIQSPR